MQLTLRERRYLRDSILFLFGSLQLVGGLLIATSIHFVSAETVNFAAGRSLIPASLIQEGGHLVSDAVSLITIAGVVSALIGAIVMKAIARDESDDEVKERIEQERRASPSLLIALARNSGYALLLSSLLIWPFLLPPILKDGWIFKDVMDPALTLTAAWVAPPAILFALFFTLMRTEDEDVLFGAPSRFYQARLDKRVDRAIASERREKQAGSLSVAPDEGALQGGLSEPDPT